MEEGIRDFAGKAKDCKRDGHPNLEGWVRTQNRQRNTENNISKIGKMVPYLFACLVICVYLGVFWLLLFVIVLSLYLMSSGVNRKDAATKQLGAGLLWLSVSILLLRFIKKHNLINRKWMRWLLVFISPAAILTIYLPAFFLFSLDLPCKCMLLGTWGEDVSRQMINIRAGVDFPSMSFVTGNFIDEFPDFENNCTMRLKNSADQSFLQ